LFVLQQQKWSFPLWRAVISTPEGLCWALNEINLSILSHRKSLQSLLLTQDLAPISSIPPILFHKSFPFPSGLNKPKEAEDRKTTHTLVRACTHACVPTHTLTKNASYLTIKIPAFSEIKVSICNGFFKVKQSN
jgi:hypothetical protein